MRRRISEEEFAGMFREFRFSAFRLETRDHYALDYEERDFRRFLHGTPTAPTDTSWWAPWLNQIRLLTAEGKRVERVRVLAEPPSDYQRWELWAAPWHAEVGERISYLPRSQAKRIGLPASTDWWLFDGEQLVLMGFDEDGRITGKILVTGPEVAPYRAWRDLAVSHAAPAEEIAAA